MHSDACVCFFFELTHNFPHNKINCKLISSILLFVRSHCHSHFSDFFMFWLLWCRYCQKLEKQQKKIPKIFQILFCHWFIHLGIQSLKKFVCLCGKCFIYTSDNDQKHPYLYNETNTHAHLLWLNFVLALKPSKKRRHW